MYAKELATQLGISPSTLSLILNNKSGISAKLRNEVLSKIQELGHENMLKPVVPDETKPKTIYFITYIDTGKLVGADTNMHFPFIIEGIESQARLFDCTLICHTITSSSLDAELEYMALSNCVGFILFAPELPEDKLQAFLSLRIPFVVLENHFENMQVNSVRENNRIGIQAAFRHLTDLGHRDIGYLCSGLRYNCFTHRQRCVRELMENANMPDIDNRFYTIGYPDISAYEGAKKLLESSAKLPTAFLADCDVVSIGAMKAFKEKGYSIPEDFSFIGFDDLPICKMVEPNLTTIHIYKDALGEEAVNLLFRLIRQSRECMVSTELSTKLIIRDSTTAPADTQKAMAPSS